MSMKSFISHSEPLPNGTILLMPVKWSEDSTQAFLQASCAFARTFSNVCHLAYPSRPHSSRALQHSTPSYSHTMESNLSNRFFISPDFMNYMYIIIGFLPNAQSYGVAVLGIYSLCCVIRPLLHYFVNNLQRYNLFLFYASI